MADESTPLAARLLGAGARGAGAVGRATGIDKAVEIAAEEAIVSAVESEAVERAIARVLEGPVIEEAVQGALDSAAVKKAILETLDSELVDEVWRRLLAWPQIQQMVERIAEAPEVRAAIASQSVGLIGDIGRQIAKAGPRPRRHGRADPAPDLLPPPPAAADQPGGRGHPRRRVCDRRGDRQPLLHRARRRGHPAGDASSAAAATACREAPWRPAPSSGWWWSGPTWSASGRWPGRRRGCASSASA